MGESHFLLTLNKTRNNILGDAIQEQLIREHCYTSIYNGRTLDMCESTERSSRAVACLHHIITLGALVYLHNTHTCSHAHTHTHTHTWLLLNYSIFPPHLKHLETTEGTKELNAPRFSILLLLI